jgi:hypothetical protein
MYDPGVGRWLEEDPIGFDAGDPNLYRYVGNAPTNETDPSGLVGGIRHHPYPLFLGGSNNQPAFVLLTTARPTRPPIFKLRPTILSLL